MQPAHGSKVPDPRPVEAYSMFCERSLDHQTRSRQLMASWV
jgi:hypothetical protein